MGSSQKGSSQSYDAGEGGDRRISGSASTFQKIEELKTEGGGSDGWIVADPFLMVAYHGDWGWCFPQHPHTGFETVTCVLPGTTGFVDHFDSLGNSGRYGPGDVQWMTAGSGVSHSEVSVHSKSDPKPERGYRPSAGQAKPTGWMFQLWLNLPSKSKMAAPAATMLWSEAMPMETHVGESGKRAVVRTIAGPALAEAGLAPPPDSWAADPANAVQILHAWLEEGSAWTLARSAGQSNCVIYAFGGAQEGRIHASTAATAPEVVPRGHGGLLRNTGEQDVTLTAEGGWVELLVLEGMPIGEPVCWQGPMVTESQAAMQAAIRRYRSGGMGEWSHEDDAPVNQDSDRFAHYGEHCLPPAVPATAWPAEPSSRI